MSHILRFALLLLFSPAAALALDPPLITHEPINSGERNKAITVVTQVDGNGSNVKVVYLHFSTSSDGAPTRVAMSPTGVGAYYGLIPARYTASTNKIYYYIEAGNEAGEWAETPWSIIELSDEERRPRVEPESGNPTPSPPLRPPVVREERSKWFWPGVALGGAVIAGGAYALSDSGGGGGGGSDNGGGGTDPGTGPTPGPDTGSFTQGANDSAAGSGVVLPKDTIINATSSLAGRTINTVDITVDFNPVDGRPDAFAILYEGNVIFNSGAVTEGTSITRTVSGDSPLVVIRVISSQSDEQGRQFYSWNATATFNFSE